MSDVRLIEGDCLQVLRDMPAGSVDAVVTDPPYCSGGYLEAQKHVRGQGVRGPATCATPQAWFPSDNLGTAGLLFLLRSMMVEAFRLLRPGRSALVFTDWRMVPHLAPGLESSGLRYRNMLIWDKGSAGLGVGFKPAYEVILEFAKGTTEYQVQNGQNLIRECRVTNQDREHAAQKPVALLRQLIRVVCPPGGTVLDPFAGSGTTGIAALAENRKAILIEREPAYCDVIRRRLAGFDGPLFAAAKGGA